MEHLAGRWFTPDELINVLQISGVNLFPRDDSSTRVECLEKNPLTEQWLYEQMALLSPAMSFSWSRWNADCQDPKNIIVCATEHLDEEGPVDEATIGVFSVNRHKVVKLRMKEYAENFDPAPDPKYQSYYSYSVAASIPVKSLSKHNQAIVRDYLTSSTKKMKTWERLHFL
ncbi:unnamed protein product [Dibothriocephalus latus]|uniref:Uncharacterized protein n=1 Tax=Dibothriocephalus latus TaxID=60516 RepID=A0A3P7NP05_DIBLA|nr:unnamed protein product [Dibothriocephalus latus]